MKERNRKSFDTTENLIGQNIQDILDEKGGQVESDQIKVEKNKKKKRKKSRIYLAIFMDLQLYSFY